MLDKIIAYVESNNDQFAIRFEPLLYTSRYNKYTYQLAKRIASLNQCSLDTAKIIIATSWGKYQILGSNLYTVCSLKECIGKYLCNPSIQDKSFFAFLEAKKIDTKLVLEQIKTLALEKQQIQDDNPRLIDFTNTFKKYLESNKEVYSPLFRFITTYNGSRFLSDSFYAYLLRVLYFYNKLKGVE